MAKDVMFRLRVTEGELAAWKASAAREGLTVSAWLRSRVGGMPERAPVVKAKKGTPAAAGPSVPSVPPPYDKDRDQAPPVPVQEAVPPDVCRRCGHARASHWIKGCLAGCPCSEGRYRE